MFPSSLLNTDTACSDPIVQYYLHHLQESLFQHPKPVFQDAADDLVPLGYTNTLSVDRSKVMNVMTESAPHKKKKSDNRSKIRTAQGLRDRRVRMSMGTARKFFDLQDLLGFDKPSRTFEWLLTNSNKAILGLSAASSLSLTSYDQETAVVERLGDSFKSLSSSSHTPAVCGITQAGMQSCNAALKTTMKQKAALLARESRDMARARARARTKAKFSIAKLNHRKYIPNNPTDVMSSDHPQTNFSANDNKCSSISMMKSVISVSQEGEERKTGEYQQPRPMQGLQLAHSYDSVIKTSDLTGFNPILSQTNCVYPLQGSFAGADQLNLPRDYNSNGSTSWESGITCTTITEVFNEAQLQCL